MTTLEKIRAEIEQLKGTYPNEFYLKIIDKYASEECDRDCEHCAYLECPKEPCEDAEKVSEMAFAVAESVCDNYCKKPQEYSETFEDPDEAHEEMLEKECAVCPMAEFIKMWRNGK